MTRVTGAMLAGCLLMPCVGAGKDKLTTKVHCERGDTINAALSRIDKQGPNTLLVYGTCRENVVVESFEELSIIGQPATLLPSVETPGSYTIAARASRLVRIDGLTINAGAAAGILFDSCLSCELRNSQVVAKGVALLALNSGSTAVRSSTLMTTAMAGSCVGVWSGANLSVEDSVIDGASTQWPAPWSGVMVGEQAGAHIRGTSVVKGFAEGIAVSAAGFVGLEATATIEDNFYVGVFVETAGRFWTYGTIRNNGAAWSGGGIHVEPGGWMGLRGGEVTGNRGGGIRLAGKTLAAIWAGTVSGNGGPGIAAYNDSMVSGPTGSGTTVSGNQGPDLYCDSTSMIIRAAGISGDGQTRDCPMIKPGE